MVWIIVNIVAMPIYLMKGLQVTAGLYFFYLVLAVMGLTEWRKMMKKAIPA